MDPDLNVLFLAAEAEPLVKIGGLGDVAGSLPKALRSLKKPAAKFGALDVRLVIPVHGGVDLEEYGFRPAAKFAVPRAGEPIPAEAWHTELDGVPVYGIVGPLIVPEDPVYSADPGVDGPKFTFFSLAALELARSLDWRPHVLHANDWHTAPAVYWLALHRERSQFFADTASILEVHNLPYLGVGAESALASFDLPPATGSALPRWARRLPLPLGLLAADHIVTVSPGYAAEILTPEFGSGLEGFLRTRADSITGILNGLDLTRWDPANDPHVPVQFSDAELAHRVRNKIALQAALDLPPEPDLPVIAMITRLDHQKGVDIALEALRKIADRDWQAVILGTGDPGLERSTRSLASEHKNRVRALIQFDPALSRKIYAGADMMLIPSRYEPCGLTQMIAMRYGCVPVARATGGLRDTIRDYDHDAKGTGFLFQAADSDALASALRRSLDRYSDKRRWIGIQRRGMREDFSWERSARRYANLYQDLLMARRA